MSDEQKIMQLLLDPEIIDDPYAWVMTTFCWGKKHSPLEHHKEPRKWQADALKEIARFIHQHKAHSPNIPMPVFRKAFASGRGIGKSAFNAWLAWWFFSTRIGASTIIAANGKPQLMSYTFPELRKWITLAINGHWADATTTKITPAGFLADIVKRDLQVDPAYWFIEGKLWSEENPDAFAGAHNHKGMMVLFDEASGIPQPIWSVTEGYFTEPTDNRFWLCYSNPRRADGAFFDCFHNQKHRWGHAHIDSRDVEGLDHSVFNKLVEDYGEDSDIVRVEVRGLFPTAGFSQFISLPIVAEAQRREYVPDDDYAMIMSVDVARYGDDQSVILFRQGRDARSLPIMKFRELSTMQLANKCFDLYNTYKPDVVVVDGGGVGGGVVDRLREMRVPVREFDGGGSADDKGRFLNLRAEAWSKMRDWLATGCLPDDPELETALITPQMEFTEKGLMKLESKKDIKARGLPSPDEADALAMSMIVRTMVRVPRKRRFNQEQVVDYDVHTA
jgi:hypothetical protein